MKILKISKASKLILSINLLLIVSTTYADDKTNIKTNAFQQIESTLATKSDTFSMESANMISFPTYLNVTVDNKWQFSIKSKQAITVSRIMLTIDDTSMVNTMNLEVKPNVSAYYFFTAVNLQQIVQSYGAGYKFLGVYKQINADDFNSFTNYSYKKLQVSISWSDDNKTANKSYYQSVTNFLLVFAK